MLPDTMQTSELGRGFETEVFVIFKQNHDVLSSINFVCRLLASQRASFLHRG